MDKEIMKITIKAQASHNAKSGIGRLKVTANGKYHVINAVVFTRSQAKILKDAAGKSKIITKE